MASDVIDYDAVNKTLETRVFHPMDMDLLPLSKEMTTYFARPIMHRLEYACLYIEALDAAFDQALANAEQERNRVAAYIESLERQNETLSENFDRVEKENNRLKQLQGVQHA
jgi:hypothetical protein